MDQNNIQKNLIEALGLSALPEKEQEEVVEKFSTVLFQAVTVNALEKLDDRQKNMLEKIMEKDPENIDRMMEFFKEEIPDFQGMVNQQIQELLESSREIAA